MLDGARVESEAEGWFLKHQPGSRLLERNCRYRFGEIDLVFELSSPACEIVFVEVRARVTSSWVSAVESVTPQKVARLRRAIAAYLASYRGEATAIRFDLLGWDGRKWEHRPNLWI